MVSYLEELASVCCCVRLWNHREDGKITVGGQYYEGDISSGNEEHTSESIEESARIVLLKIKMKKQKKDKKERG